MNKRKIAFALGLFLLPIGQPIYLGTASIFTSPYPIYSLSFKDNLLSLLISLSFL